MQATLVMFKADGERREFPLTKPTVVIGRKSTCDLRIPLSSVSRQHCQVQQKDDGLYFRDLGSSNGTFYNDHRVQEGKLNAGDRLMVGPVNFTVVIDGQPADLRVVKTVVPAAPPALSAPPAPSSPPAKPAPKLAPAAAQREPERVDNDDEMPELIEEETGSPTTDIDDDPIAALEALAAGEIGGMDDDDDDDDEAISLLDEDDDDK